MKHGEARVIVFTKEELNVRLVYIDPKFNDLLIINMDPNYQGSEKTRLCAFCRDYKGEV